VIEERGKPVCLSSFKDGYFWVGNGNTFVRIGIKPQQTKTIDVKWKENPKIKEWVDKAIVEHTEEMKKRKEQSKSEEETKPAPVKKKFTAEELLARQTQVRRTFDFINLKEINPFSGQILD
jgi:hypothetical protein